MRSSALLLLCIGAAAAAPRVDNVLEKMVPPGATALAGVHFDQLRQTEIYRRLPPAVSDQLDRFPQAMPGFDPRRDIREVLYVSTPSGAVLLTRGTFPANPAPPKSLQRKRHGSYTIWTAEHSALCILDATLAVAGEAAAVEAALDEWTSGTHAAAQPLLAKAALVDPQSQLWGISADLARAFAGRALPGARANGFDFSGTLRGLGECWFSGNFAAGIHMEIHGVTANEADAASLRDTFRGIVGLGRLNVPESQPELFRVWDGMTVEQKGRSITFRADISQTLANKLLDSLGQTAGGQNRRVL